ncbi:hypothetical protein ACH5RR_028466 [Cinchona calisaya]|uniref:Cytochrome P450 n=1 Tax=Cinchona calisaya TaxID=153742 RepID=A0ABD2YST5_9GENT
MKEIENLVQSIVSNIINKRVKAMQQGEASNDDLLSILLESNFLEIQEHGNKRFGMTFEEAMQECKLFYFVGHETTSSLLVWTLILLAQNSEWQDRARDEARSCKRRGFQKNGFMLIVCDMRHNIGLVRLSIIACGNRRARPSNSFKLAPVLVRVDYEKSEPISFLIRVTSQFTTNH